MEPRLSYLAYKKIKLKSKELPAPALCKLKILTQGVRPPVKFIQVKYPKD
jgi:hypothetical protein